MFNSSLIDIKLKLSPQLLWFFYSSMLGHFLLDIPESEIEYKSVIQNNLLEMQSLLVACDGLQEFKERRSSLIAVLLDTTVEEKKEILIAAINKLFNL